MENKYSRMWDECGEHPKLNKLLKLVAQNPMTVKKCTVDYYMTEYKGLYYRFRPKTFDVIVGNVKNISVDVWEISDREDGMGFRMNINADIYRIDECIELYKKGLKEIYGK